MALASGLIASAWVAVARSAALAIDKEPTVAIRLAPGDARIIAAAAERLLTPDAGAGERDRAAAQAVAALRRDPTSVRAVAVLGLGGWATSHAAQATRLRRYANRLSRRNLRVQLWSIEASVSEGDYRGALSHYDEALRTQAAAKDLLFPILEQAIADPLIRSALVDLFTARPPWARDFLVRIAGDKAHTGTAAKLLVDLSRARYPLPAASVAILINTLVVSRDIDAAWRFYAATRPAVTRDRIRNSTFSHSPDVVRDTSFDWQLVNGADIATDAGAGAGSHLTFTAGPSAVGLVARQLQYLPPGSYRLAVAASVEQAGGTPPVWRVICPDGTPIAKVPLRASTVTSALWTDFSIPRSCRFQWLELELAQSDGSMPVSGTVNSVAIEERATTTKP